MNDRRIAVIEVAEDVGISIGSSHEIISGVFGMKRVTVKFKPKMMNYARKQRRMQVAQESLKADNNE